VQQKHRLIVYQARFYLMVEVITQEIRQEAQQQQERLKEARQSLEQTRRQTESQRVTNIQQLSQKQSAVQNIQQAQSRIAQAQKEFERISALPTADEYQSQQQAQQINRFEYLRKIANSPLQKYVTLIKDLGKNERAVVEEIRSGVLNIEKYKQSLSEFQAQELEAKTLPSETTGLYRGAVPQGYSQIQFRETGRLTPLTQGAVRPQQSELLFREYGIRAPISKEVEYFTTTKYEAPQISKISPIRRAEIFIKNTIPSELKKTKTFFQERGFKGAVKDIYKATTLKQIESLSKPPSQTELIGLLLLPAFMSGASAQSEFQEVRSTTGELIGFRRKRIQQFAELLEKGITEIKTPEGIVNVQEITRQAILKNRNNPEALAKLRAFYKKLGREQLFNDLVEQEIGGAVLKPTIKKGAVDNYKTIELSSQVLSQAVKPQQSEYYGTGQYEKTQETTFGIFSQPQRNILTLQDNLSITKPAITQIEQTQQRDILSSAQSPFFQSALNTAQQTQQVQRARQEQENKQRQRFNPLLGQSSLFRQAQQQRQQQQQRQRQSFRQFEQYTQPTPRIKTLPRTPFFASNGISKVGKKSKENFIAEIRRFNRWNKLTSSSSYNKVFSKATNFVDKTLGASFRIKKDNIVLPLKSIPRGFYKKGDVAIEKRENRLSTSSEINEIMGFKKSKQKRGKFL